MHPGARRSCLPVIAAAMHFLHLPLGAQAPASRISGTVSCTSCAIDLRPGVVLAVPSDTWLEIPSFSIFRTSRGEFLMTGLQDAPLIGHYGADGRLLRRFGAPGDGPGEYREPLRVIPGLGDSLRVVDRGLRRVTVLDPALRRVRDFSIARFYPHHGGTNTRGELVLSEWTNGVVTREGHRLQVVGEDGLAVVTIGGVGRPPGSGSSYDELRSFTIAVDGSYWIASANRYRLEQWSPSGALLRTIEVDADWYRPWIQNTAPIREPSKPAILGLDVDAAGRIWIFISVTAAGFRSSAELSPRGRGSGGRIDHLALLKSYDTVVQVLDPDAGTLLASARFPGSVQVFSGFGATIARIEEDGTGGLRIVVLERILTGAP